MVRSYCLVMLNRDRAKSPLSRTPVALGVVLLFCAACGGGGGRRPISTPQPAPPPDEAAQPAVRLDQGSRAKPSLPAGSRASAEPAPTARGVRHVFQPGQTLYSLARAYKVPLEVLMRANAITDPTAVREGTSLFIPGARRTLEVPPTFPASRDVTQSTPGERGAGSHEPRTLEASALAFPGSLPTQRPPSSPGAPPPSGAIPPPGAPPSSPPRTVPPGLTAPPGVALGWPLRGMITSRFGLRGRHHHHEGVDIDGTLGEEILAAASGTVVRSGREGGYGRTVVIDHGGGLTTLYAHASRLLVREGDEVQRGEPIAEVGRSGNARGSHLHFEVHRNGRPIDPMPMLRTTTAAAGDSR
jgi:murein DD-endopeptidase MepM/ murein hydrolase activator NlpD